LANDFGAALGVGGHLSSLRRTKIGSFKVEDAMQIAAFEQHIATLKGETNTKL
jgi:tRNA pseudouridine55 synthase